MRTVRHRGNQVCSVKPFMKKIILFLSILAIVVVCYAVSIYPRIVITKLSVDERGLISVQFKYCNDTMAYDYLTQDEFNKFIQTGDPY